MSFTVNCASSIGVLWIETAVEGEDTIGGGEDIHLIAFRGCESFDGAVKFVEHAPLAVLQTAHTLAVGHPGLSVLSHPEEYRQRVRVNGTGVEVFQGQRLHICLIKRMLRQHIGHTSTESNGKNGSCLRGYL